MNKSHAPVQTDEVVAAGIPIPLQVFPAILLAVRPRPQSRPDAPMIRDQVVWMPGDGRPQFAYQSFAMSSMIELRLVNGFWQPSQIGL